MSKKVQLGDEVLSTTSGFKGVAVGITEWLHGCKRVTVQPKVTKEGTLPDSQSFDIMEIKVTKQKKIKRQTKTGGPQPEVKRGYNI